MRGEAVLTPLFFLRRRPTLTSNMISNILTRIFGSRNERLLNPVREAAFRVCGNRPCPTVGLFEPQSGRSISNMVAGAISKCRRRLTTALDLLLREPIV